MTSVTLLRAVQSRDLGELARIHRLAFPHGALVMLGTEAIRRYYEWQLTGPHDAVAMAAMIDNSMAGYCFAGSYRGALSGFLKLNRLYLGARVALRPWLLLRPAIRGRLKLGVRSQRGRPAAPTRASEAPLIRHFGVLSIAVDPQFEGRGVGTLLMEEAERIARQRQFDAIGLTVARSNIRAVRFYQRLGFRCVETDGDWNGFMQKSLIGQKGAEHE